MENTSFADTVSNHKELDPDLIRQRAGGRDRNNNQNLFFDYLEWHVVTDILDKNAPHWSSHIKDMTVIGEFLVTTVVITIDGVTREGVGTGLANSEMGIKKSEHDGLKRAALKFGVGRQLYQKQKKHQRHAGSGQREQHDRSAPLGAPPEKPVATTLADMISTKQLGLLRAVARDAGQNADEVCLEMLKCKVSELSRKAASWLIDFIRSPEFQSGAKANVVQMPERTPENTSPVSPKIAGDLLFKSGAVKPTKNGYSVAQTVAGKPTEFEIKSELGRVTCSCGDFKTQVNIMKKPEYQCAHIVAAELHQTAVGGVQASA